MSEQEPKKQSFDEIKAQDTGILEDPIKKENIESKKIESKKPSFEEYKAAEKAKQDEALEKARQELEEKYNKAA